MEDIASEAGLSRAALYLQFRNKEDIFRELAAGLHERCLINAEVALTGRAPLVERLQAAVESKTLPMIEITNASPHGSELMDETNRLCGDLAAGSARRFQRMLADAFRVSDGNDIDLKSARLTPPEAADLFASAIHGLKSPDVTPAIFKKRLARFVTVFTGGLR
jgi:AcrR family transcriptional regulator